MKKLSRELSNNINKDWRENTKEDMFVEAWNKMSGHWKLYEVYYLVKFINGWICLVSSSDIKFYIYIYGCARAHVHCDCCVCARAHLRKLMIELVSQLVPRRFDKMMDVINNQLSCSLMKANNHVFVKSYLVKLIIYLI